MPWLVLIGGNARTGKSTLASYLRIRFSDTGFRVLQVALDNWLLPEEDRNETWNVYKRFQLGKIEDDLQKIISGHPVTVASYINHPERDSHSIEYNPQHVDIIIIEGVVALSSPSICKLAHLKIFTTLNSVAFKKRLNDYYLWRGKTEAEIEKLVNKREIDEYQLIEKESNLADLIINSSVQ
jgi:uridine kinase